MSASVADKLRALLKAKNEARAAAEKKEAEEQQKLAQGIKFTVPEPAPVPERKAVTESQEPATDETPKEGQIILNEEQELAVTYATEGREFCLIGAAGSGKTTASIEVVKAICARVGIDIAKEDDSKKTIAIVAFTRRAARNSAKNLDKIKAGKFCKTAHRFLEYQPEYFEYMDEDGNFKKTMRFVPGRTAENPIHNCRLVIVEEASMLGTELHADLKAAAPNATFLYIGDLNQLPPVFGDAILGFKLAELPVVELTKIYRQALESPIVHFQHNYTLPGKMPSETELQRYTEKATDDKGLEFIPFKQTLSSPELYAAAVANYMIRQYDAGLYDPNTDTILIPFNKAFGSVLINEDIAEELGNRRKAVVWEIMTGFQTKYLAVGDFVMHEKAECTIIDIQHNPQYMGKSPMEPSEHMTRAGLMRGSDGKIRALKLDRGEELGDIDHLLNLGNKAEEESTTNQASAIVTVQDNETQVVYKLQTAGDMNGLDFGYCMTIHKSQGSEWRKVWLVVHKLHATMLSRELLYTGMTRAKDKLSVLYTPQSGIGRKDSSIAKAIKRAVIPGKSWKEKVEYFKGKAKQFLGIRGN